MSDWVVVAQPRFASEAEAIRAMLAEEGIVAEVVERTDLVSTIGGPSAEVRVATTVADVAMRLIAAWRGEASGSPGARKRDDERASAARWGISVVLGALLLCSAAVNVWLYSTYAKPRFSPVWTNYDSTGFPTSEMRFREGAQNPFVSANWSRDRKITSRFFDDEMDGWFERSETTVLGTHGEVTWVVTSIDVDEDGKTETTSAHLNGELASRSSDRDRDGWVDLEEEFKGGDLVVRCDDANRDLNFEVCASLVDGREVARNIDR